MTTKTIPEYLEDERQKRSDDQLRIGEEAARIQPLHHGHHRTAKQPKLELPSPVGAAANREKNCRNSLEKATRRAKDGNESPQDGLTPTAALAGRTWQAAM